VLAGEGLVQIVPQLRPVWSRRRMIEHHRSLVRDLETTGDLDALRRNLADGLEAVSDRA
jgi:hypothetical protein